MKTRTRVTIFIIVFIILSVVFAYGSTAQMSQAQAQSISQGVQGIPETTLGIFRNNVQIALIEFIPGFGPAFGVYTSYDTGVALAGLAEANPSAGISGLESFFVLVLTPIFWLEFFCYSLAVEESISVIISFKNRDFRTNEWKWLAGSIFVVIATLFVSAQLEVDLINFLR